MARSLGYALAAASLIGLLVAGCAPFRDEDSHGEVLFVRGLRPPEEAIYLMSADGSNVRRLVAGSMPRWSPDGSRFAYASDDDDSTGYDSLWVMNPDTGTKRRILQADAVWALAWAPDGVRLAYSNSRHVFVVDTETGDQRLVSIGIYVDALDWSPDGREILLGPGVRVLDVRTGAERAGVPGRRSIADGRWSPDGERVVFTQTGPLSTRRPKQFIVVAGRHGTGEQRLTAGAWDTDPAWSDEGDRLFLSRGRAPIERTWEIYSIDLDTRELVRLTDNDVVDRLPDARLTRPLVDLPDPPQGDIVVPDFVDRHVLVDEESLRLAELGLKLSVLPIAPEDGLLAIVREQVPTAGARVPEGTVVQLDVIDLAALYVVDARRFNARVWKAHRGCAEVPHPRESMYFDVVRNVVRKGMSRKRVLSLLGDPERSEGSVSDWPLGRQSLVRVDCMLLRVQFDKRGRVMRVHQWYR